MQNVPHVVEEVVAHDEDHHHRVSVSTMKHAAKLPKPPVRPLPTVHSTEDSSSTRSVTSRRRDMKRSDNAPHYPEAAISIQNECLSVFKRLGAKAPAKRQEEEPRYSGSIRRVLGNKVKNHICTGLR